MAFKGDMNSARPPVWMTAWLQTLIPPRDQEIIAGDLLEEYREVVLPSNGMFLAHLWYVGEIAGFLRQTEWYPFVLRTGALWLALFIAALAFLSPAAVAIFLIAIPWCGFFIARRSCLFWAGASTALLIAITMFAIAYTVILALRIPHPPATSLLIPGLLATVLATISAFVGRCNSERIQPFVFPRITTN